MLLAHPLSLTYIYGNRFRESTWSSFSSLDYLCTVPLVPRYINKAKKKKKLRKISVSLLSMYIYFFHLEQDFGIIQIPIKAAEVIFSDCAHISATHGIFFCEMATIKNHMFLLGKSTLILSSAPSISQMKFWKNVHLLLSWWKIYTCNLVTHFSTECGQHQDESPSGQEFIWVKEIIKLL